VVYSQNGAFVPHLANSAKDDTHSVSNSLAQTLVEYLTTGIEEETLYHQASILVAMDNSQDTSVKSNSTTEDNINVNSTNTTANKKRRLSKAEQKRLKKQKSNIGTSTNIEIDEQERGEDSANIDDNITKATNSSLFEPSEVAETCSLLFSISYISKSGDGGVEVTLSLRSSAELYQSQIELLQMYMKHHNNSLQVSK
jgi:hypothetical protein